MNACSLSLLFSNSEYTYLFEKLLAWTVEEVEKWVCFVGFEEEAALFSSKQHFHERPCMVVTTGSPESQQHTGSQIIRICMGIYLKIDKTVKMYKNSY